MKGYGKFARILWLSFVCATASAQSDEGTDIYLADLGQEAGVLSIGPLTNITNRQGYDNQPYFLPNGEQLFYTSAIKQDGMEQMDALLYTLATGKKTNMTRSRASEYSPTYMPQQHAFSVIRVGDDGKQKFWSYPMSEGAPKELLANVEPVGYHAWNNSTQVLLFVLADVMELQLADISNGRTTVVDYNIGPSLYQIPGSQDMSYTRGDDTSGKNNLRWDLLRLDPNTLTRSLLTSLPQGAFYYAWTPDGKALAAVQGKLYQWDSRRSSSQSTWTEFANVSSTCVKGVTRLAVSLQQHKLAIVCNR